MIRSALFVPADSEKKLAKVTKAGADVVIVDLEDSIAENNKNNARKTAAKFLEGEAKKQTDESPKMYVRVNAFETGITEDDLNAVMPSMPTLHGIVLPKCRHGADVVQLDAMLRVHEAQNNISDGQTKIIAMITETAEAIQGIDSYRSNPRLAGLAWATEDLLGDIGATQKTNEDGEYRDLFKYARTKTLIAAVAANTQPIDTVFTNFKDDDGLRKECQKSAEDGFTAKLAIHPSQVPIINDTFKPTKEQIEEAKKIIKIFEEAGNPGVVAVDGVMLDQPHLNNAKKLVSTKIGDN